MSKSEMAAALVAGRMVLGLKMIREIDGHHVHILAEVHRRHLRALSAPQGVNGVKASLGEFRASDLGHERQNSH